jgi:hypothetical protein
MTTRAWRSTDPTITATHRPHKPSSAASAVIDQRARYQRPHGANASTRHLASYVAGVITPTLQMPTTGVATYTGHAIGNVQNGINAYVAAGSFTMVWNFATQYGSVTIGNFDGVTYNGVATQITGPGVPASQYNGAITGGGRTGNLTGSFFTAESTPAKGTGGSFNVNGTNYKAGGIFAGQRP